MSEEGNFWFRIWSLALAFVVALMLCITYTMAGKREQLGAMVSKGADPIKAACALDMYDNQTVCVIHVTKEK
jgi:hypothetical protein